MARQFATLLTISCAYGLGGGGMLAWLLFVFMGPPFQKTPPMGLLGSLLTDAGLCILFFIQHSIMVRQRFRAWSSSFLRPENFGVLYAGISGACLLALVFFWKPFGPPLLAPPDWVRWVMVGVYLLAGMAGWWAARSLSEFDALGVRPALNLLHGKQSNTPTAFSIRGPYRWVRHPLYSISLVIIWCGPVYTLDRLLYNFLWSIWIVIGARLEEHDLTVRFGDAYRSYRTAVPMLIPKSFRPMVPDNHLFHKDSN